MTATPLNDARITHSAPSLGEAERLAAASTVSDGFVGYGPRARALEQALSRDTGHSFAFAVGSGFQALGLALQALDLAAGARVSLPVLTCGSVLAAVQRAGYLGHLTDIRRADLTIDPTTVHPDAAAVVAPHAYGAPVDATALARLGLPWIEDCSTSPACRVAGRPAGASGTAGVFSFASTKYVTGGAGGVLVTSDSAIATRVDDLLDEAREHPRGRWRHAPGLPWPGRMADLNAAVALVQWQRLAELAARRRALAEGYRLALADCPSVQLPAAASDHAFYRFVVRTGPDAATLATRLAARGIDARSSVNPWLDRLPLAAATSGGPWPGAEHWRGHLLSLPLHPGLDAHAVAKVAAALREALTKEPA